MSDFKKGKIMDNEKKRVKKSIKKWGILVIKPLHILEHGNQGRVGFMVLLY